MPEHWCTRCEYVADLWVAYCACGFQTDPSADLGDAINYMMDHALRELVARVGAEAESQRKDYGG